MEKKNFRRTNLGRLAVAVAICAFMLTTSMATTMGNSVKTDSQQNLDVNTLNYKFLFKAPTLESRQVSGNSYATIDMQGCAAIGKQIGDPDLPVKFIKLLLPAEKAVQSVAVSGTPVEVSTDNIDLTTQRVYPYQREYVIGSNAPQEFVMNSAVYSYSNIYPSQTHGDYDIGYSHGYAIFDMGLSPVQYNPVEGKIFYYPEMTVTINLAPTGYVNQFYRNNPDDRAWVEKMVDNPEIASTYDSCPVTGYPGGLCDPSQHYDYVIVTTTQNGLDHWDIGGSLTYNWDSLIAQHAGEGLSCTEVTIEDINACPDYWNQSYYPLFNDTPAHLREFCKDAYQDWGTQYVLIAGDCGPIPSRLMDYAYESGVDADIYFSNLDNDFNANHNSQWGEEGDAGFDLYAELYIGRVPCEHPQDVSNWLTKCFYYADSSDPDYLENAAFYGGDSTWNCQGDDFVDFGAVKTTDNWLGPDPGAHGAYPDWLGTLFGFETWNQENPNNQYNLSVKWSAAPQPNPGWQGGDAVGGLRNDINNNNVALLSAFAHADQHMSCDVYDTDWASLYHNTEPFFITDMGCHCGDFDASNGVLDVMLFNSNTYLAFACTYNTGYGWGSFDDTNSSSAMQMKCFWDYFFDVVNNSQSLANWQFGKGQAWSKDEMAPTINWTYDSAPGSWRGIIESCLYFGDPAQTLKTPHPSDPPAKPSKPNGPNLGIWHVEYTYTSTTTDPNGDDIYYIFNWGDGTSTTVGPYASGQTGTAKHTWDILGNYSVTVRARDIWGAGSPPSDPLLVTITDNNPPNAPVINGPATIKPLKTYLYTITTIDPEGQNVFLDVDWGDGHASSGLGPYRSGDAVPFNHAWDLKGSYTIKVRARDTMGGQTDWTKLNITVSLAKSRVLNNPLLIAFLERFPNAFPVLRHLLGL